MNTRQFLAMHHIPFAVMGEKDSIEGDVCVARAHLVRTRDGHALVVIPEGHDLDLPAIAQRLGQPAVTLATTEEVDAVFDESDPGVVPGFAQRLGLRTLADVHMAGHEKVMVPTERWDERVVLRYEDFQMVEQPILGLICKPQRAEAGLARSFI